MKRTHTTPRLFPAVLDLLLVEIGIAVIALVTEVGRALVVAVEQCTVSWPKTWLPTR